MRRNLEALSRAEFDLAVIGGGVNGAATAREAALRGLKVALIEGHDFASGTSSRSSKLIHGGLRYLKQREFHLVRESRRERRLLLKLAPHLAQPLPFLLPIYRGDPYAPVEIRAGLTIYDWLGNLGRGDRHHFYRPAETLHRLPSLRGEGLRASAVYHDSLTDDARLTLEYVLDAAAHGAVVANYAEVRAFSIAPGRPAIAHAEVADRLTGGRCEVAARFWINATGPWVDRVRKIIAGYDGSRTIRTTKGVHLILPSISETYAVFAAIRPGERIFVIMPWHGIALLGTTDTEYDGDLENVEPDEGDIEYLLGAVNRVLREPFNRSDVLGSFAGLRPLVAEEGKEPSEITRDYRFHRDPWAENLITVCGGKLTTARALGEKLLDLIVAALPAGTVRAAAYSDPSRSAPVPGGHIMDYPCFVKEAREQAARTFGVSPETAERIARTYGSRWRSVLAPIRKDRSLGESLTEAGGLTRAEAVFSIREEMAMTIGDFLLRRSGLNWVVQTHSGAGKAAANVFARELGWSDEARRAAILEYARLAGCSTKPASPATGSRQS